MDGDSSYEQVHELMKMVPALLRGWHSTAATQRGGGV